MARNAAGAARKCLSACGSFSRKGRGVCGASAAWDARIGTPPSPDGFADASPVPDPLRRRAVRRRLQPRRRTRSRVDCETGHARAGRRLRRALLRRARQGRDHRPRARPRHRLRCQDAGRHRDLYARLEGARRQSPDPRHPRPQHRKDRGSRRQRPVAAAEIRTRRARSAARQQAHHPDTGPQCQGARDLPHLAAGFRFAVARRGDDRGQAAALHVQPVAGDPRALVGAAAGHAAGALSPTPRT